MPGLQRSIATAAACALGGLTEKLCRLHMLRRFAEFKRRWATAPLLEFAYEERQVLYRHVNESELAGEAIDYLEFGCWRGDSMRLWCGVNRRPESRFFGFDSFEGLPEHWNAASPKGAFSKKGQAPKIDDARVTFVKGLFQQSLPGFLREYAPRARQVVHLDADLYSATLYVLMKLDPPPGSIVIFDQFSDVMHEFRAFENYLAACAREYRVVAARRDFHKLAVELL